MINQYRMDGEIDKAISLYDEIILEAIKNNMHDYVNQLQSRKNSLEVEKFNLEIQREIIPTIAHILRNRKFDNAIFYLDKKMTKCIGYHLQEVRNKLEKIKEEVMVARKWNDDTGILNQISNLDKNIQLILARIIHIEDHLTNLTAIVNDVKPEIRLEFKALTPIPEIPPQKQLQVKQIYQQSQVQERKTMQPTLSQKVIAKIPDQISKPQVKQEIQPIKPISQKIILESQKEIPRYKLKQKKLLTASEIIPYVLLFAFYLLLSVTIYVSTQLMIQWFSEGFLTSLNIFLYIYIVATLFILSGYLVHRTLKKKKLTPYLIFPQSFFIVGIIGYFLSFIIPFSIIAEQGYMKYLIWGLAIGSLFLILILVIKGIYYEFFIGECYLFITLLIFIPTIFDISFFGPYTNIILTSLFIGIILGGFLLGIKGVSFTPAIITLICLSIMSLGDQFAQNVSLIIVLLALAGFSLSWILNHEISFKTDFYSNKMSQLVLFIISLILPNIGIYVLIAKRYILALPIWDLVSSAMVILCTYFVLLSSQKRQIGKNLEKYSLNVILGTIFINMIFQLFLITSTRYILNLNVYEMISFSTIWIILLIGVLTVAIKQISELPVLIEAVLVPFMILSNIFSSNIYFPLILLLLSSLSLSWVQYKNYGTKESSNSIIENEKFVIIAHQFILTLSLSIFLFQGRNSYYSSLEYFGCIFLFQLVQFLTIKKRKNNFEEKFSKFDANILVFITFGANMILIFFGAISEIIFSPNYNELIFIIFTVAYFILSFMPLFGAKYLSGASNLMKISFQTLGLVLSQILFILNGIILEYEEYALLFYLITVGHLLMAIFLPIIFPDSKEFRSFSIELLLLVMIDLWIIRDFFEITIQWLLIIRLAVFIILSGLTIFYAIIYYLDKCEKKTVRLFKQWEYAKLILAGLLVINAILTILYRDAIIFSLLIISSMISNIFAILSIKKYQKDQETIVDNYFISIFAAIVFIICAFSGDIFHPIVFLIFLIISFLFMMGIMYATSSNHWLENTIYLALQFFISNYLLNSQFIVIDIMKWVVIGFYGISSIIFLYRAYKYNSKQGQEIIFSEINILWALHFYTMNSSSQSYWILFPALFLVLGKIGLEMLNVKTSEESINSQPSIKKNLVFHGVQLLINIFILSFLSYILGFLLKSTPSLSTGIWIQYFLFIIFFSANIPFYIQSKFKIILTLISPMLIFVLDIIMRYSPSFVNYVFFILTVGYAVLFLMNFHKQNKENGNKLLLLGEIYLILILISISCLLTELSSELKFGFIFTFVLLSLYLNTMFKIHKARVFQVLVIAGVGFSYIIYVLINANYASLIFLLVGIGLILGSFIKYRSNLAEMNDVANDSENNDQH